MGYTFDTQTTQFIPPDACGKTAGTWTPTLISNVPSDVRGAAAAQSGIMIPIEIPSNAAGLKGARLKSIDVYYKIATAALTDFATVELEKITLPPPAAATGTVVTGAAVTITQDAYHNTAALRKAIGDHTMTVILTTPVWIDDNDAYVLYLYLDCAATSVVTLFGARANYDLRV